MDAIATERKTIRDPASIQRVYNPLIFDVSNLDEAKERTIQSIYNSTSQERWRDETLLLTTLLDRLALTKDDVVLDYGCGTGRMAKALIDRFGCTVVGVDISPSMLQLATDYVDDSRFSAMTIEQCDELNLVDFDAAIAVWVLQHCQKPEQDIAAIHRQLKTNGKLAIVNDACYRFVPYIYQPDPEQLIFDWFEDEVDIWAILDQYFDKQSERVFPANGKLAFYDKCRTGPFWNPEKDAPSEIVSVTGGIVPRPGTTVKTKWAGIVRLGGLGDNLQAAAVLKPLAEQGYLIDVITQEPGHVIFENNPYVTKLSVKKHDRDLPQNDMNAWQAYFASRANEYDKFANLSHIVEGMLAFVQAQTGFWWPDDFRRKLANHSYIETMADCIGVPYDFGGHLFFPTDEEHADAERMYQKVSDGGQRNVIGWCVTGTRIDKIHPYSPMIVARLIRELNASVVMFAAPPPYRDIETVKIIHEHVVRQNSAGQWLFHAGGTGKNSEMPYQPPGQMIPGLPVDWPIRRTLTMAMHCDLVIGPDTGVPWAVAFEKTPKIMMLSHASPTNITKHWVNTVTLHADPVRVPCNPCHKLHESAATCVQNKEGNGAACISDISVETIVSTAARLLNNGD